MIRRTITAPQLGLIAGTRAALGAGIALLLADRLTDGQRRAVGWTLVAVGALSTIPLAAQVFFADENEARLSGGMRESAQASV
ncbi:MAG TPA: hypothetical protein VGQ99_12725 [Tepidisphaeraceae bacterium]|jgi:hypothetical protein|nr:hypothetical protein [Tepidisphaeraceae bacterium]